ncbi:hypothetical protein TYRP_005955 [Tyrophagus putrescentiae]|nr:hypothetical protein TYRP_005955 [Tyrophagus putrescentiae]
MYSQQSNKCLVAIVKDFLKEFDDELTVKRGQVVQFVGKLDRYWFEVYCDGQTGKVPISSCREWNSQEMSSIRLVKASQQAAFVSKYDFLNDCVEGDLRFSAFEIIIGFEAANDDWWKGTRLASIKNSITSLSVREENCGIFPLTHVWRLREDLLPDSVFTANGVIISSSNDSSEIEPALGVPVLRLFPRRPSTSM